jgi:hypothetical protein
MTFWLPLERRITSIEEDAMGKPGSSTSLKTYTTGLTDTIDDGAQYNLTINFTGSWSAGLQNGIVNAAERIAAIITGDVPDYLTATGAWIDDIVITANLSKIDGRGGVLANSDPDYNTLRDVSFLPSAGVMQFDSADASRYLNSGLWDELVSHEMLHAVGFVSRVWEKKGLIDAGAGLFTGPKATDQYHLYYGDDGRNGVPLSAEHDHWSEEVLGAELMTPAFNPFIQANPLSPMTAASLADLGYAINMNSAAIDRWGIWA